MDIDLVKDWVVALRSNDRNQGKNRLKNKDNEFCCLGVLLDIVDSSGWTLSKDEDESCYDWKKISCIILPYEYTNKISPIDPHKLVKMNDRDNKSFEEIADYIESCIK